MDIGKILFLDEGITPSELVASHNALLSAIQKIRDALGDDGHIMDSFIHSVLTAFNKIFIADSLESGFQEAPDDLRRMCAAIRDGRDDIKSHPFYPTLRSYIEQHPCPATDIFLDYYCACLSTAYAEFALGAFMENRKAAMREAMQEAKTDELEKQLLERTDPALLENVYNLLIQRLLIASPAKVFLQGMNEQLILNWLTQGADRRYVFQHILDEQEGY